MSGDEIVIGMSGGSGAVYGVRALEACKKLGLRTHLVLTDTARQILGYETGLSVDDVKALAWKTHAIDDFFAPIASGSHRFRGMLVAPASMKTIAGVASGYADDLLLRTADVCLKEKRPLVIVWREAPLSVVHCRNLLACAEAGAVLMPAAPGFYTRPKTLDDAVDHVVGKGLEGLGIEDHGLYDEWKGES